MIRDMTLEDIPAVIALQKEQGFEYSIDDLSSPLFFVKKVREEGGRVVAAMLLRITAETFLICAGSPVSTGRAIEELQPEVIGEAWTKGLSEIICVIPPPISDSFAPVLLRMGWNRTHGWPMWQKELSCEMPSIKGKPPTDQP